MISDIMISDIMISIEMRQDPLFTRNGFSTDGKWQIPIVERQYLDLENIDLIACSDTKSNETETNRSKGVHFFVDDYRFN